jgi:hypothetical protein
MKIDLLVAKLIKKGMSQSNAEQYANQLTYFAKSYGVSPNDLIDQLSPDFKLNDLGSFAMNNAVRQGYQTGKMTSKKANALVDRTIIR